MAACHRCGAAFPTAGKPSRQDACPSCNAWLRSCRNCEFFSPKHKNDCLEPHVEPVADKDQANFCEYYAPNKRTGSAATPRSAPAKDSFDALFERKSESKPAAKDPFDALFKK